ncbi:MAG: YitT family protein [Oscillospiraceae bacterium]|nr:YitT family protein [Oscillospiraceae bacterium]
MKTAEKIFEWIVITFATVLVAAVVYFFMVPSNLSVGSITGLAIVISNLVPLTVSQITMIMNAFLLVIGFIFIGKEFGAKTVYTSLLLPVVLGIFEKIVPDVQSITGDQFIDCIAYSVFICVAQALLFTRNASSGGLDIVGKLMNKYLRMELGSAISMAGMAVALSSVLVYDLKTVVISVLGTYFSGIFLDRFLFGSTIKKRVCILSKKNDEILQFILHELHSGATLYHAYGAYTEDMHKEINVIVDKSEYLKLMNYITKTDPDAFMTVYTINEVMYRPKEIK